MRGGGIVKEPVVVSFFVLLKSKVNLEKNYVNMQKCQTLVMIMVLFYSPISVFLFKISQKK